MRFSVIHHAVAWFRAGFYPITGSYDAATRTLTGEVRTADLQVPIDPLRNHLLTADFFDAEQHATIAFTSTRIDARRREPHDRGRAHAQGRDAPGHRDRDGHRADRREAPRRQRGRALRHRAGGDHRPSRLRRQLQQLLPYGTENLGWDVRIDVALELIEAHSSLRLDGAVDVAVDVVGAEPVDEAVGAQHREHAAA